MMVEHVYGEEVKKAMEINAQKAQLMSAKLYSWDIESFWL